MSEPDHERKRELLAMYRRHQVDRAKREMRCIALKNAAANAYSEDIISGFEEDVDRSDVELLENWKERLENDYSPHTISGDASTFSSALGEKYQYVKRQLGVIGNQKGAVEPGSEEFVRLEEKEKLYLSLKEKLAGMLSGNGDRKEGSVVM